MAKKKYVPKPKTPERQIYIPRDPNPTPGSKPSIRKLNEQIEIELLPPDPPKAGVRPKPNPPQADYKVVRDVYYGGFRVVGGELCSHVYGNVATAIERGFEMDIIDVPAKAHERWEDYDKPN